MIQVRATVTCTAPLAMAYGSYEGQPVVTFYDDLDNTLDIGSPVATGTVTWEYVPLFGEYGNTFSGSAEQFFDIPDLVGSTAVSASFYFSDHSYVGYTATLALHQFVGGEWVLWGDEIIDTNHPYTPSAFVQISLIPLPEAQTIFWTNKVGQVESDCVT